MFPTYHWELHQIDTWRTVHKSGGRSKDRKPRAKRYCQTSFKWFRVADVGPVINPTPMPSWMEAA